MLDQLRQGAQGWVSKLLMAILVVSFAIWGIGGFEGYGSGTLATVGDEEISIPEFARAYQQYQRSAQSAGREVQPGVVLDRMLLNAALDDQARSFNLGVSSERVAQEIASDATFRGAKGFDKQRYDLILQNAGIRRQDYEADIRQGMVRQQLAGVVAAGIDVPQPMLEAAYRFQNEERTVSSLLVDESAIEPVGDPGEGVLQAYFEENKDSFTAPEYRTLGLILLDPAALAEPAAVSDEEVEKLYEQRKASLTKPERRRVEQITFATPAAATAALEKAASGVDFAALAQDSGAPLVDLGMKTQAEFPDAGIAAAAFAAEPNAVVAVTEGVLQPSLIRVTAVEPGSVTPLEEIADKLRSDVALRAARERVNDVYDQIEDERAGGALLEEAAAKLSLPYRTIAKVSREGLGEDGKPVADLPASKQLLEQAFESDVGIENNALRLGDGSYVFFEVLDIVPARQRPLDEVRDEVVAAWRADETAKRIEEKANALFARLQAGESLATLAAEINATVQTVEGVKRGVGAPGLSANAAAQAFGGPQGHVANAEADTPPDRILLRVDQVVAPLFLADSSDVKSMAAELQQALQNDVLSSFNRQLLQARDTRVNNTAFAQLTGAQQAQ
jgi:peptidyl-prolyl cis-trans isomerase D